MAKKKAEKVEEQVEEQEEEQKPDYVTRVDVVDVVITSKGGRSRWGKAKRLTVTNLEDKSDKEFYIRIPELAEGDALLFRSWDTR